jgi:phosphopantothenoylcysteine decarboxylase/phosphopantothenate--cysteine ligase
MAVLPGKHIVLGITGSIAAFKAAELASQLAQMGALLDVILTPAAEKFISPLTLQSVTGRHAFTEADLWGGEAHVLHVGLGQTADLLLIAPCTANTLAKLAHGEADNLLTITALAARCPLLLAPAMDGGMLDHPATRANLDTLVRRGAYIAGPAEGHLASGLLGKGRLVEPAELIGHIRLVLGRMGALASKKVVVSAGGTQEPLDPVRVLTNKSSGKQGYALAQAAIEVGAEVTLISTPTTLAPPVGAHMVRVQTAREMLDAVLSESADADVLIMAAAVADFRPTHAFSDKLKSRDGVPHIELEATEDILKAVAAMKHSPEPSTGALQPSGKSSSEGLVPEPFDVRGPRLVVGFAAESRDLIENAAEKLKSKQLNLIVANDITARDAGFGADTNRVTIIYENGDRDSLPLMSKAEVADAIIERIAALLE